MSVKVTFNYDPYSPDDDDRTGMSESEYEQLVDALAGLGADGVEIEKVD